MSLPALMLGSLNGPASSSASWSVSGPWTTSWWRASRWRRSGRDWVSAVPCSDWPNGARAAGLSQIRLYTNEAMTENLAYYPRHGYRETHRGIEDGYRRVYFTKVIDLADEDHSRARERIPVTGEGRSGLPAGVVVGEDDPGGVQPL